MKVIKAEDTRLLEPFRDRIIEGDCLEVMKSIPGESIDMILCDLPYGTTQNTREFAKISSLEAMVLFPRST